MSTFTDPTEDAFTVSVPAGWSTKGGVQRASELAATVYVVATSPDSATTIGIGDPSIPPFALPTDGQPAGGTVKNAAGATATVAAYETGAQFAADYAQRAYGSTCTGMQAAGTQAEPDLVQQVQTQSAKFAGEVGAPPPSVNFDGASARFTCQFNGAPYAVGVLAVTGLQQNPNGPGGYWAVPAIVSYRTPAASQAPTEQMARSMEQSLQHTPQWDARMASATKQLIAGMEAQANQLAAMTQRDNAMLNANENRLNANLNAGHAAFMQQFNAQGAARTAAWNQHMYNKETGQQSEMRYINNQTCVQWWDAAHTRCRTTAQ